MTPRRRPGTKNTKKGKKHESNAKEQVQQDVKSSSMAGATLDPCLEYAGSRRHCRMECGRSETEKISAGMEVGAGRARARFSDLGVAASLALSRHHHHG